MPVNLTSSPSNALSSTAVALEAVRVLGEICIFHGFQVPATSVMYQGCASTGTMAPNTAAITRLAYGAALMRGYAATMRRGLRGNRGGATARRGYGAWPRRAGTT